MRKNKNPEDFEIFTDLMGGGYFYFPGIFYILQSFDYQKLKIYLQNMIYNVFHIQNIKCDAHDNLLMIN